MSDTKLNKHVLNLKQRVVRCLGRCQIWNLNSGWFWVVQCPVCLHAYTIVKHGRCACCGNAQVRGKALSGMQSRGLAEFYDLANKTSVLKFLEQLQTAKSTREVLYALNSFKYHDALLMAQQSGLIERKRNGRTIMNKLSLKGERFLQFASIYNSDNCRG